MSNKKTIRAWKDPEYRESLTAEELAHLPSNPAGLVDLTDGDLGEISGGVTPAPTPKPRTLKALCIPLPPKSSIERCGPRLPF